MTSIDRHAQVAPRHRFGFAMPSFSNAEPGIFPGKVEASDLLFPLQALHDFDDKP